MAQDMERVVRQDCWPKGGLKRVCWLDSWHPTRLGCVPRRLPHCTWCNPHLAALGAHLLHALAPHNFSPLVARAEAVRSLQQRAEGRGA